MDYSTLHNKNMMENPRNGENMMDLLTLSYIEPFKYKYKLFKVTREYIARPDLISLAMYGSTNYVDVICKFNGISNPFEVNEGMVLALPTHDSINSFAFKYDNMDSTDTRLIGDGTKPKPKSRIEKRKANEAVIGDTRYKIDKQHRVVIY